MRTWIAAAVLTVALVAFPFMVTSYTAFQATQILIYAIVLIGANLLTGYSGQISLGQGAFFAIGAYVAAILIDQFGLPYFAAILVAAGVSFVAGLLFGLPALRLEGHYLALATFALAVAMPQLLKAPGIEAWTGGVQGIVLLKPAAPLGLPLSPDQFLYFLSLAFLVALILAAWNLVRGHIGRALVAMRDHPIAARSMGVHAARYKTAIFGIGAFYAGIGGALSAITVQFVAPDSFPVLLSIGFLVGLIVGGVGTISGAIYGAIFIQVVPNVAQEISKAAPWAIYGLFLLFFVVAMPAGVAGLVNRIARRWRINENGK